MVQYGIFECLKLGECDQESPDLERLERNLNCSSG
jgi:hypothetical protein